MVYHSHVRVTFFLGTWSYNNRFQNPEQWESSSRLLCSWVQDFTAFLTGGKL
jgi:hypothetical protein